LPGLSVAGQVLEALGGATEDAPWKLRIGRRAERSLDDQDGRVRSLLSAVNLLIGRIQHEHLPITLVVDGLDRMSSVDATRRMFLDSRLLGELACVTLVTAPLAVHHEGMARKRARVQAQGACERSGLRAPFGVCRADGHGGGPNVFFENS
jgi:hypothetical protein